MPEYVYGLNKLMALSKGLGWLYLYLETLPGQATVSIKGTNVVFGGPLKDELWLFIYIYENSDTTYYQLIKLSPRGTFVIKKFLGLKLPPGIEHTIVSAFPKHVHINFYNKDDVFIGDIDVPQ